MEKLIYLILLHGLASIPGSLEENLALNGTATQSSVQLTWLAQNAIDGKKYGSEYCFATSYQSNPWWRMDLLDVYNISTVIITTHATYLTHANGAEIRVGNSLENNGNNNPVCAVTSGLQAGRTITYSCHGMLGRYVNVFMPGRTAHLSMCEVEVYGTENLASKGTVTQSSTNTIYVAGKAKDGGRYDGDTCSCTGLEINPWWRLDLLDVYNISTVIISTRFYPSETNGAEIRIGNSLDNNGNNNTRCAVISGLQDSHTISYSCHGISGRYVNVIMTGPTNRLSLCEMEVYGTENFAFKGTATQPSTYLTWIAQHAVDGVRYGSVEAEHCSSTPSESNPWWRLDLLDYYEIDTVIIAPKPACCREFTNGAEIRIGNSLVNNGNNNPICAVISGIQIGVPISYSCGAMEGRYVNVVMTGRTTHLTICEVEVYGKRIRKRTFLRLKMSSSGDVAAESDKILLQLQSALGLNNSDVKLSWTQRPEREEEEKENRGSCVKHL